MYVCMQRCACMCSDAPTPICVRAHINTHAHTHFRAQALVPASVTWCRGGVGGWMRVCGGTCARAAARESPSHRVTPCQAPPRTRSTLQCVTPPLSRLGVPSVCPSLCTAIGGGVYRCVHICKRTYMYA